MALPIIRRDDTSELAGETLSRLSTLIELNFSGFASLEKFLSKINEAINKQNSILSNMSGLAQEQIIIDRNENQREQAKEIEDKRESRFKNTLSSAASGISNVGLKIKDGVRSGPNILSTLIGAAVLGAIFAPEQFDKIVGTVKQVFTSFINSEFLDDLKGLTSKFIDSIDLSDLLVTAIFGWRVGVIKAGAEFIGELLTDRLLKDNETLSDESKEAIKENVGTGFALAGIAAFMFPRAFFGALTGVVAGLGRFIFSPFMSAAAVGGTVGAETLFGRSKLTSVRQTVRNTLVGKAGERRGNRMIGAVGLLGALTTGALLLTDAIDGDGLDFGDPATVLNAAAFGASIMTTLAPALLKGVATSLATFLVSAAGLKLFALALPAALLGFGFYKAFEAAFGEESKSLSFQQSRVETADNELEQIADQSGLTGERKEQFLAEAEAMRTSKSSLTGYSSKNLGELINDYDLKGDSGKLLSPTKLTASLDAKTDALDKIGTIVDRTESMDTSAPDNDISDASELDAPVGMFKSLTPVMPVNNDSLRGDSGNDDLRVGSVGTQELTVANMILQNAGPQSQAVNIIQNTPTDASVTNIDSSVNNNISRQSIYESLRDTFSPEVTAARKFAVM